MLRRLKESLHPVAPPLPCHRRQIALPSSGPRKPSDFLATLREPSAPTTQSYFDVFGVVLVEFWLPPPILKLFEKHQFYAQFDGMNHTSLFPLDLHVFQILLAKVTRVWLPHTESQFLNQFSEVLIHIHRGHSIWMCPWLLYPPFPYPRGGRDNKCPNRQVYRYSEYVGAVSWGLSCVTDWELECIRKWEYYCA